MFLGTVPSLLIPYEKQQKNSISVTGDKLVIC